MTTPTLPPHCFDLAARGQWVSSWQLVAPQVPALVARGDAGDLLWLHELCLRLGLDTRRRWLGRQLQVRHGDRLPARTTRVLDLLRLGRHLDAWTATREPRPPCADPAETLGWLLARARVHSQLRDLDAATRLLHEARDLAPDDVRVDLETAWTHQDQDRLDEALAVCRAAQQRHPDHPMPRLQECWFLHDANDAAAGPCMAAVRRTLQSPHLDAVYASHCLEAGDPATARQVWTGLLAEPHHERAARRVWRIALVRTCRDLGDDAGALAHAEAAGRVAATYAERLRTHLALPSPRPHHRVVLDVPFVRQDHMTCSPATMASLLRTFGVAVDQREIAAQITYDGTASHDELAWARGRGLVVRFFQFDAEVARDLLDRGLPFAITTRFESSSHRQAVIGYDRVLDTFLLRDPTGNFRREVDATWLATVVRRGGECALLLPAAVAERCAVPPLPQEAATMDWLQLRLDWREHRLACADRLAEALLALPPGPLRFDVEARVCSERGDRRRQLELYRQAHEAAPDDPYWQYHFAGELLDQNRWQEARERLEQWAPKSPSPFLRRLLADQWRHDVRRRPAAERLLRRALRQLGKDARSWHRYASLVWDDPARREEAAELYRLAAAMAPHDEWLASSCFWALHDLGRAAAGLDYLRARCERFGAKSPAAAATLAQSLETLHQPEAAMEVLQAAVAGKDAPDERQRLFDLLLRHHRHAEAEAVLTARHDLREKDLAMCRHALARARGDHAEARRALADCIRIDPWHVQAQQLRLEDLLEHDGPGPALAAADALVAAHAESPPLMVMVVEFYGRLEDRPRGEALLRRLAAEHPHEHWLRGRLARHLLNTGQMEAARPLLDELRQATPDSSPLWVDIATCEHGAGNAAAARAAARRAFELAPDNRGALRRLVDWAPDAATAAADVRFAMQLAGTRPVPPDADLLDGLLEVAAAVPAEEFAAFLAQLERDFPATAAPTVARCEFAMGKDPAAALPIAEALVARQPWRTAHWLRHAACLRACQRRADERAVLEQLLQRDPGCAQAYVELGESFEQEGRLQQAMAVLQRGLTRIPGYAILHGMVAEAAWRLGERDRALTAAARAWELDRSYSWACHARVQWLVELDRHAEALAVAEEVVAASPRWTTGHELHASVLGALGRHDERVTALRTALALSPRLGRTRLRLLDALIELKRFDEARTTIAEGRVLLGDDPPLLLREVLIERTAGQIVQARKQLRQLLDKLPDFHDGWIRYLTWCDEDGRHDDILALHRDPPPALQKEPVRFGYAADALRRRGDLEAADQALQKALELDPGYQWARDVLCEVVLERGTPARVLELLPDHGDPASLPFHRAVLVAKAAARLQRHDLADATFARLLQDPGARGADLGAVDALLRKRQPKAHDKRLAALVADAAPGSPLAQNHLRVLAARGRHRDFWTGLTGLHEALGGDRGDIAAAALLADVRDRLPLRSIAHWVRDHVRGPVRDTGAAGNYLYALADHAAGGRQSLRLFAADWQRPDVQGWMLANLADALLGERRLDEMAAVCRHALAHVPHDHSYWWHRRYLAEAALRAGRFAEARELCRMPVDDHPRLRLTVHQLDVEAELRSTAWWRRGAVLRGRLRTMFHRYDTAVREDGGTRRRHLRPRRLLCACPGPTTILLCCGDVGVRFLRTLSAC